VLCCRQERPVGWGRISMLGGSMPNVDLVVAQAPTGERAFVQVTSRASQAVLDDVGSNEQFA
jgi:hypothetical protein